MDGKIVIVTGANSGMGIEIVKSLADKGAKVIMICRDISRGQKAYEEIAIVKSRNVELMICDLGSIKSILDFVQQFKYKYNRLDILINNAGVISLDRRETTDGLEQQFGVNHIGHFALTTNLLDLMKSGSRIVVVASGAHNQGKIHFDDYNLKRSFNVVKAYGQSKLANVLFTRELAERLKGRNITVNCCHPGAVATNMGVDRKTGFGKTITSMLKPFFLTAEEGARTAIYLASSDEVEDITGEYFYKCKVSKSSEGSKDVDTAKKLYELSEVIVEEIKKKANI